MHRSVVLIPFDERHENNGNSVGCCRRSIGLFGNEHESLLPRPTHGNDHSTSRLQLLNQGCRNMVRGGGDDDGVEWCIRRPALIAVAHFGLDVGIAKPP